MLLYYLKHFLNLYLNSRLSEICLSWKTRGKEVIWNKQLHQWSSGGFQEEQRASDFLCSSLFVLEKWYTRRKSQPWLIPLPGLMWNQGHMIIGEAGREPRLSYFWLERPLKSQLIPRFHGYRCLSLHLFLIMQKDSSEVFSQPSMWQPQRAAHLATGRPWHPVVPGAWYKEITWQSRQSSWYGVRRWIFNPGPTQGVITLYVLVS